MKGHRNLHRATDLLGLPSTTGKGIIHNAHMNQGHQPPFAVDSGVYHWEALFTWFAIADGAHQRKGPAMPASRFPSTGYPSGRPNRHGASDGHAHNHTNKKVDLGG